MVLIITRRKEIAISCQSNYQKVFCCKTLLKNELLSVEDSSAGKGTSHQAVPRSHVEGENQLLQAVLWSRDCFGMHAVAYKHTYAK